MIRLSRVSLVSTISLFLLILSSCGKDSPTEPEPETPVPARISITPSSATMTAIGQTEKLTATVYDQFNQPITDASVTWSSSNAVTASVSAQGLVTAMMNGTARITATAGGITAFVDVSVQIPNPDQDALVALYNQTDGPNWTVQTNWLSDAPLRDWHGVKLNEDGRVEELHLADINLKGPLPAELAQLEKLRKLVLRKNELTGNIPPELGQLVNLRELDLAHNRLTGNIPSELGNLENLIILFVDENRTLSGPIPRSFLNLTLSIIWDVGTQLCLPPDADFREWRDSIANVRGLTECNPERNVLVTFYNSTNGEDWTINTNWLSGAPLGEWYGVSADASGHVTALELNDNNLQGALPPELSQLRNLTGLVLRFNRLTGTIPPEFGQLEHLTRLELLSNRLTGTIPPELGQLKNLETLPLLENQLTGNIPPELGQLKNLEWFSVSRNRLTGTIPPELGQLESLGRLFLYGNQLTGSIPVEFGQLENLRVFELFDTHLTGNIPPELGQLKNLRSLLLFNNRLTGTIPPELGQLENLQILWLDNNQLEGSIPEELGQLKNLRTLWLYNNRLTGSIPGELGRMESLTRMSLSANQLTGSVPEELGQIESLKVLLLRDNSMLSGPLPRSLTRLDLLSLWLEGTGVCVPGDDEFSLWLGKIPDRRGIVSCQSELISTGSWHREEGMFDGTQSNEDTFFTQNRIEELNLVEYRLRGEMLNESGTLDELETFYNLDD